MEFLVRIEVIRPIEISDAQWAELQSAEANAGRQLLAAGALRRIWRVPGRRANVSLYEAADATELHAHLSALPLWPYMDVVVEALADHPLQPQCGTH